MTVSNYTNFDTLIQFQRGQYLFWDKIHGKKPRLSSERIGKFIHRSSKLSPTTFNWTVHTTLRKVDSQRCTHGAKCIGVCNGAEA